MDRIAYSSGDQPCQCNSDKYIQFVESKIMHIRKSPTYNLKLYNKQRSKNHERIILSDGLIKTGQLIKNRPGSTAEKKGY